ncbi:hypothetical protein CRENBAI_024590 [Crenichthys baileyi]|uniref:Uncharacterized protein n=1 Tax=Crenichthys baileyi TaxID=28760 RepID=A0AAV9QPL6_9TELE
MMFKLHFSPQDAASPAKFADWHSLMSPSWTLLLIDQDQTHVFIAQRRLLIWPPPQEHFKTIFLCAAGPRAPGSLPVSHVFTLPLCCSPKPTSACLISAL